MFQLLNDFGKLVLFHFQVIEILGKDNMQISPKQVKQIIDLIGKRNRFMFIHMAKNFLDVV